MNNDAPAQGGAGSTIVLIVYLALIVLMIAGLWKIFSKAGEPGWAAIIPIYNLVVLLKIVGRPIWWLILFIIPFVNFIMGIIVAIDLAKSYGKGVGYGLLLAFLPFIGYPMLGFGSDRYVGPSAAAPATA
ncbi:MAG: DUF5684 domain-containing protein [Micromonosporaceae bacterium]